jgi:hypothetical protein
MDINEKFHMFDHYLESVDSLPRSVKAPLSVIARYVFESITGESAPAKDLMTLPGIAQCIETIEDYKNGNIPQISPSDAFISDARTSINEELNAVRQMAKDGNSDIASLYDTVDINDRINALDLDEIETTVSNKANIIQSKMSVFDKKIQELRDQFNASKGNAVSDDDRAAVSSHIDDLNSDIQALESNKAATETHLLCYQGMLAVIDTLKMIQTSANKIDEIATHVSETAAPTKGIYTTSTGNAATDIGEDTKDPLDVGDVLDLYSLVDEVNQVVGQHGLRLNPGMETKANEIIVKIQKWIAELNTYKKKADVPENSILLQLKVKPAIDTMKGMVNFDSEMNELKSRYAAINDEVHGQVISRKTAIEKRDEMRALNKDIEAINSVMGPFKSIQTQLELLDTAITDANQRINQHRVASETYAASRMQDVINQNKTDRYKSAVTNEFNAMPYTFQGKEGTVKDALTSILNRIKYMNNKHYKGEEDPALDADIEDLTAFTNDYYDKKIADIDEKIAQCTNETMHGNLLADKKRADLDRNRILRMIDSETTSAKAKTTTDTASETLTKKENGMTDKVKDVIKGTQVEPIKTAIADVLTAIVRKKKAEGNLSADEAAKVGDRPLEDFMNGATLDSSRFVRDENGKFAFVVYLIPQETEDTEKGDAPIKKTEKTEKKEKKPVRTKIILPMLVAYEMSKGQVTSGVVGDTFVIQENAVVKGNQVSRWSITFSPNDAQWKIESVASFNGNNKVAESGTHTEDALAAGFESLRKLM